MYVRAYTRFTSQKERTKRMSYIRLHQITEEHWGYCMNIKCGYLEGDAEN